MTLDALLRELEENKKRDQEKRVGMLVEQHQAELRAKDQEIASLREEIDTLKTWLDHSALPAFNPISRRKDSLGLVKLNFSEEKRAPDFWEPGEKALLDSVDRKPFQEPLAPEDPFHHLERPERPEGLPGPENPARNVPGEMPEPRLSLPEPELPSFSFPEQESFSLPEPLGPIPEAPSRMDALGLTEPKAQPKRAPQKSMLSPRMRAAGRQKGPARKSPSARTRSAAVAGKAAARKPRKK